MRDVQLVAMARGVAEPAAGIVNLRGVGRAEEMGDGLVAGMLKLAGKVPRERLSLASRIRRRVMGERLPS